MKTIIKTIISAVALSSSIAMAQSYSQAVAKQSRCQLMGRLYQESHEHGTINGKTITDYSNMHDAATDERTKKYAVAMVVIFSSAPQGKRFATPQDAYMAGWAECMDGR